jgi:hypothetical protein
MNLRPSKQGDIFGQYVTSSVTLLFCLLAFAVGVFVSWAMWGWIGTMGLIAFLLVSWQFGNAALHRG